MSPTHAPHTRTALGVFTVTTPSQACLLLYLAWLHQVGGRPSSQVKEPASPFLSPGVGLHDPFSTNRISRLDPVSQLHKYGYMTDAQFSDDKLSAFKSITKPLKKYQRFYGLNETGVLDNATLTLMRTPRCGTPDFFYPRSMRRKKRYALIARWVTRSLSYSIGSYRAGNRNRNMTQDVVERVIARAFKTWSDASALSFNKVAYDAIIAISFESGYHGDKDPFDGEGGILAHAYFPQAGGDVHLDADEPWTDYSYFGVNLFQIIAHELGHSLGMAHTNVRGALMYAYYRGYQPNLKLHRDDIAGIQELYGAPTWNTNHPSTSQPVTPTQRPQQPTRPQWPQTPRPPQTPYPQPPWNPNPPEERPGPPTCPGNGEFNAIFSIYLNTYAVEGTQLYKLNAEGVETGYPIHINTVFGTEIQSFDTAIVIRERRREYVYIFQGSNVWKFDWNLNSAWPEPRHILTVFPGITIPFDSAFYSQHYKAIYFFKDSGYYRCSSLSPNMYRIDHGYPRETSVWNFGPGVRVSAVFNWAQNGRLYIFSGQQYYRYDERRLRVDPSIVPYPRDVRTWWLGCTSANIISAIKLPDSRTNSTDAKPHSLHEAPDENWLAIAAERFRDTDDAAMPVDSLPDMSSNDTEQNHKSNTYGMSGGIYRERIDDSTSFAGKLHSSIALMSIAVLLVTCKLVVLS